MQGNQADCFRRSQSVGMGLAGQDPGKQSMGTGGKLRARQERRREPLKQEQAVGCSGSQGRNHKEAGSERGKMGVQERFAVYIKVTLITGSQADLSMGMYIQWI